MATYLLDTSILLQCSVRKPSSAHIASMAVQELLEQGNRVCITSQTIIEFWVVATRPTNDNGLGWSAEQTRSEVEQLLDQFQLLEETPQVFSNWLNHVSANKVIGKQVHNTRLIAVMLASKVTHLLTLHPDDFENLETIAILHPQTILENNTM